MADLDLLKTTFEGRAIVNCPDPTCSFREYLFPPPSEKLPPLILHIRAPDSWGYEHGNRLTTLIGAACVLPLQYIEELIDFGAVYYSDDESKKAKRVPSDVPVTGGSYCRVHVNPKRYLNTYTTDWNSRIVSQIADLIVIDKPYGVPSQPLVDNLVECSTFQVQQALALPTIHVTSRIDVATSGLQILAKTSVAAESFNKQVRSRGVRKEYLVCCEKELPLGPVRHLCRAKSHKKRKGGDFLLSRYREGFDPTEWSQAVLEILEKTRVENNQVQKVGDCWQYRVRIISGRTHQIRLQLAALSSPVIGDTRYWDLAGVLVDDLGADEQVTLGPDPERICLQAAELEFEIDGRALVVKAGLPWWVAHEP
ncbi:hypothetical protein NDN08_007281 [Rhodosorus marinus]|uniref:Pseudouridine synthase RsuA/RluA-like domain-containing protein n=1 Tax=Rhodosorus marinus TaxID=101924 RepID=A0AAV8UG21_9RHOD|nr:hypothetical protein NDN08_007281 [Rhodosorus marinus]